MNLAIEQLAQRCAQETERFFRRAADPDNRFCFELFRRAFVERNQAAWAHLYQNYQPLVTGWIREHPQFAITGEETDYFLNGVFVAMWKSCTPERFARFGELPAILAYLKSCVHTTIFNQTRRKRPLTTVISDEVLSRSYTQIATTALDQTTLDQTVLDQMARTELWGLLDSLLNNAQERLILERHFLYGLKPRQIYEAHADLFANVQEVYRIKQNLLERLSRNVALKTFYQDHT